MVSEASDELLEKYLHGQAITEDEIKAVIRKRTIESVRKDAAPFVPVICGSAFKNKGVQPLLDAVVDYLPSPLEIPAISGHRPAQGGRDARRAPGEGRRPVCGAGLQDHDRPVRRSARVHSRVFGRSEVGHAPSTTRPSSEASASAAS